MAHYIKKIITSSIIEEGKNNMKTLLCDRFYIFKAKCQKIMRNVLEKDNYVEFKTTSESYLIITCIE